MLEQFSIFNVKINKDKNEYDEIWSNNVHIVYMMTWVTVILYKC